jgi:hypothetical protein
MNQSDIVAEQENPGGETPDMALLVDTQIMRLLGVRFEIADDIIKVWPNDVVPDETNWLVGERFSRNLDESLNVLAGLKVEIEFFNEGPYHWAVVSFGDEGELETQETYSKEMAGAFAACAALYGRQGHKS